MQNGDYTKEIFNQLAELKEGQKDLRQRFDAMLEFGRHLASTTELNAAMMRETLARVDRVDDFSDRLDRRISRLEHLGRIDKPRDEPSD